MSGNTDELPERTGQRDTTTRSDQLNRRQQLADELGVDPSEVTFWGDILSSIGTFYARKQSSGVAFAGGYGLDALVQFLEDNSNEAPRTGSYDFSALVLEIGEPPGSITLTKTSMLQDLVADGAIAGANHTSI